MKQVLTYSALFCLEYKYKPSKIEFELRIYQGDTTIVHIPEPEEVSAAMEKIVRLDKRLNELQILLEE